MVYWEVLGDWPSGKALGSGPRIGGSNPSSPAKLKILRVEEIFVAGEEINNSEQSSSEGNQWERTDWPPFKSYDASLYANESEWRAAQSKESTERRVDYAGQKAESDSGRFENFDYRLADNHRDAICAAAAADKLALEHELSESVHTDGIISDARKESVAQDAPFLQVISKKVEQEAAAGGENFAAVDSLNAYVDMFATYAISKEKSFDAGLAKGLVTSQEMRIDTAARRDAGNPAADKLRLDNQYLKPLVDEYIGANSGAEPSEGFEAFLQQQIVVLESDARMAARRGEQPDPNTTRKIEAVNSAIKEASSIRQDYPKNLKYLKDTAFNNRWIM